jgi:mRNA-degrading endonuclease RelE of RelBE toxin-antitoxin system
MKVFFKKSFIKDFQKLPKEIKNEVKNICLLVFPKIKTLKEFTSHPLKKLRGFRFYYRIKIKDFKLVLRNPVMK